MSGARPVNQEKVLAAPKSIASVIGGRGTKWSLLGHAGAREALPSCQHLVDHFVSSLSTIICAVELSGSSPTPSSLGPGVAARTAMKASRPPLRILASLAALAVSSAAWRSLIDSLTMASALTMPASK